MAGLLDPNSPDFLGAGTAEQEEEEELSLAEKIELMLQQAQEQTQAPVDQAAQAPQDAQAAMPPQPTQQASGEEESWGGMLSRNWEAAKDSLWDRPIESAKGMYEEYKFKGVMDDIMTESDAYTKFSRIVDERGYLKTDEAGQPVQPHWEDRSNMKHEQVYKRLLDGEPLDSAMTSMSEFWGHSNDEEKQKTLDYIRERAIDKALDPQTQAKYIKKLMDEGLSLETATDIATSPEAVMHIFADSFMPSVFIGISGYATGAAGGLIGSGFGPGGTIAGFKTGQAVGTFLASSSIETKRRFMESLMDEGVDIFSVASLREFAQHNPQRLGELLNDAENEGYAVGGFDSGSAFVSGIPLGSALKRVQDVKDLAKARDVALTTAEKFKNAALVGTAGTVEATVQGLAGMGGELTASAVSGKALNWEEAYLEFIGEIFPLGAIEIASGTRAQLAYESAKKEGKPTRVSVTSDVVIPGRLPEDAEPTAEEKQAAIDRVKEAADSTAAGTEPADTGWLDDADDPVTPATPATAQGLPTEGATTFAEDLASEFQAKVARDKARADKLAQEAQEARDAAAKEAATEAGTPAEATTPAQAAEATQPKPASEVIKEKTTEKTQESTELGQINANIDTGVKENLDTMGVDDKPTPAAPAPAPTAPKTAEKVEAPKPKTKQKRVVTVEELEAEKEAALETTPEEAPDDTDQRRQVIQGLVDQNPSALKSLARAAGFEPEVDADGNVLVDEVEINEIVEWTKTATQEDMDAVLRGEVPGKKKKGKKKTATKKAPTTKEGAKLAEVEESLDTVEEEAPKRTPGAKLIDSVLKKDRENTVKAAARKADKDRRDAEKLQQDTETADKSTGKAKKLIEAGKVDEDTGTSLIDEKMSPLRKALKTFPKAVRKAVETFNEIKADARRQAAIKLMVPLLNEYLQRRNNTRSKYAAERVAWLRERIAEMQNVKTESEIFQRGAYETELEFLERTESKTPGKSKYEWRFLERVTDDYTFVLEQRELNEDGTVRSNPEKILAWEVSFAKGDQWVRLIGTAGITTKMKPGDYMGRGDSSNSTANFILKGWTHVYEKNKHLFEEGYAPPGTLGETPSPQDVEAKAVRTWREQQALLVQLTKDIPILMRKRAENADKVLIKLRQKESVDSRIKDVRFQIQEARAAGKPVGDLPQVLSALQSSSRGYGVELDKLANGLARDDKILNRKYANYLSLVNTPSDPNMAAAEARAAQQESINLYMKLSEKNGGGRLVDVTEFFNLRPEDLGKGTKIFMDEKQLNLLQGQATDRALALQFIADGTVRAIELTASTNDGAYVAEITHVSNQALSKTVNMGPTEFKVAKGATSKFIALREKRRAIIAAETAKEETYGQDSATARPKSTQAVGQSPEPKDRKDRQSKLTEEQANVPVLLQLREEQKPLADAQVEANAELESLKEDQARDKEKLAKKNLTKAQRAQLEKDIEERRVEIDTLKKSINERAEEILTITKQIQNITGERGDSAGGPRSKSDEVLVAPRLVPKKNKEVQARRAALQAMKVQIEEVLSRLANSMKPGKEAATNARIAELDDQIETLEAMGTEESQNEADKLWDERDKLEAQLTANITAEYRQLEKEYRKEERAIRKLQKDKVVARKSDFVPVEDYEGTYPDEASRSIEYNADRLAQKEQERKQEEKERVQRVFKKMRDNITKGLASKNPIERVKYIGQLLTETESDLRAAFNTKAALNAAAKALGVPQGKTKAEALDNIINGAKEKYNTELSAISEEQRNENGLPSPVVAEQTRTIGDVLKEMDESYRANAANERTAPPLSDIERRLQEKGISPKTYHETREGRHILNVGFFMELEAELRGRGYANEDIQLIMDRIIKENFTEPDVIDGYTALTRKLMGMPNVFDEQRAEQNRVGLMAGTIEDAIEEARDDTTPLGSLVSTISDNTAYSISKAQQEESLRMLDFARVPEFLKQRTAPATVEDTGVDTEALAEIEGEATTGTLGVKKPRRQMRVPTPVGGQVPITTKKKGQPAEHSFGKKNTYWTKEKMEAAMKVMGQGATTTRGVGGMAPLSGKELKAAMDITGYLLEGSVRAAGGVVMDFATYSREMVRRLNEMVPLLGDRVKDQLAAIYNTATELMIQRGMIKDPATVVKAEETPVKLSDEVEAMKEGKTVSKKSRFDRRMERLSAMTPESDTLKPVSRGGSNYLTNLWKWLVRSKGTLRKDSGVLREIWDLGKAETQAILVRMQRFTPEYYDALIANGIKLGSLEHRKMDNALSMVMGGSSVASAQYKHDVVIPEEILDLTNSYMQDVTDLTTRLANEEAVPSYLKSAIKENEGVYLHKQFHVKPAVLTDLSTVTNTAKRLVSWGKWDTGMTAMEVIESVHPALKRQILGAALVAFGLPSDPKQLSAIPESQLRAVMGGPNALVQLPADGVIGQRQKMVKNKETGKLEPAFDKKGKAKMEPVRLDDATQQELIDYIVDHPYNQEHITKATEMLINNIFAGRPINSNPTQLVSLGDRSITRKRNLLLTESQQVGDMISTLLASPNLSPQMKSVLNKKKKDAMTLSRAEFIASINNIPEKAAQEGQMELGEGIKNLLAMKEAEYALTDAIRKGLGEITSPGDQLVDTATRVASALYGTRALTEVIKAAYRTGDISIGAPHKGMGHTHKLGVTRATTVPDDGSNKKSVDEPILGMGSLLFVDPSTGEVRSLFDKEGNAVVYGNKDTIKGIHDMLNTSVLSDANPVSQFLYGMSALAKYNAVIGNPLAHPRNVVGSSMIGAARGVFGSLVNPLVAPFTPGGSFLLGSSLSLNQLRRSFGLKSTQKSNKKLLSKPELAVVEELLAAYGVLNDAVRQGALTDLLNTMQTATADDFFAMTAGTTMVNPEGRTLSRTDELANAVVGATDRVILSASSIMGESFRLEDEAIKAVAFLQRTSQFLYLLNVGTYKKRDVKQLFRDFLDPVKRGSMNQEQLEMIERAMEMAAINVRDTFPTFSRVSPGVKAISRFPFLGAFPSFHYEMLRNTKEHYKFIGKMMIDGTLPDGTKLTGDAKRKAKMLGLGLGVQGAIMNFGSVAIGGALNIVTSKMLAKKEQDEDDDLFLEAGASLLEGLSLRGLEGRKVKNALPPFYGNALLVGMPGSIDRERHTMKVVNLGWLLPEGAWIEAGVNLASDLHRIASLPNLSDQDKTMLVNKVIEAFATSIGGIYGNSEVFINEAYRRISDYDREDIDWETGSWSENAKKAVNQYLREAIGTNDDPGSPNYGDPSELYQRFAAGLVTAVISTAPPEAVVRTVFKAMEKSHTISEMTDDPVAMIAEALRATRNTMAGIREIELDYTVDYPKKLRMTQIKEFTDSRKEVYDVLLDPSITYDKESLGVMFEIMVENHRRAFNDIKSGIQLGRELGVKDALMDQVWADGTGQSASTALNGAYGWREFERGVFQLTDLAPSAYQAYLEKFVEGGGTPGDFERRYNDVIRLAGQSRERIKDEE